MLQVADRKSRQNHIERLLLDTPFQSRIDAAMMTHEWYDWGGYRAPNSLWNAELEYFAIRSQAALFDISPMVKYRIEGPDAEAFCNRLTLRDVTRLRPGRVHYTAWCDDEGQVLDDGTLFRLSLTKFRLCCQERHLPWLLDSTVGYDVDIAEETEALAGLALQGPTSFAILRDAGFDGIETLKPFGIAEIGGATISRTGFTGDLGYELFVPTALALELWDRLMMAGKPHGIRPIGYAALNRARIEAGFIVANADFSTAGLALRADRTRFPDEIGLGWLVDEQKDHFNGRRAILAARRRNAFRYTLVGLEVEGNVAADHAIVYHRGKREVGLVTSAAWSPTAKRNIAIASLAQPFGDRVIDDLWVEIYAMRELRFEKLMKRAHVVERPFVKLARRAVTPPGSR